MLESHLVTDEAAAELEKIKLREKDQLKSALQAEIIEFWKNVPMGKYPNFERATLKILSMFGSTCICESVSFLH